MTCAIILDWRIAPWNLLLYSSKVIIEGGRHSDLLCESRREFSLVSVQVWAVLHLGTCFCLLKTKKLVINIILCVFTLGSILSNLWSSVYLALCLTPDLTSFVYPIFPSAQFSHSNKTLYCMDICNWHKFPHGQVEASLNLWNPTLPWWRSAPSVGNSRGKYKGEAFSLENKGQGLLHLSSAKPSSLIGCMQCTQATRLDFLRKSWRSSRNESLGPLTRNAVILGRWLGSQPKPNILFVKTPLSQSASPQRDQQLLWITPIPHVAEPPASHTFMWLCSLYRSPTNYLYFIHQIDRRTSELCTVLMKT